MKDARYDDVYALLSQHDQVATYGQAPSRDSEDLAGALAAYFEQRELRRAVLGIDIYRYSRYDLPRQRLIPILFRFLYDSTVRACDRLEGVLFPSKHFADEFISTGDGGFQIHETPLQALAFTIWFQVFVDSYNAGMHFPKLRQIVGPLTVRYTITFGAIMKLDRNFFGPAIISNARILSRDTLNRFLLDSATIEWFTDTFGSLETLGITTFDELVKIIGDPVDPSARSVLFRLGRPTEPRANESAFRMVVVQKIGDVSAKNTALDIYNCYMQAAITRTSIDKTYQRPMVISVGNLNTSGIAA